MRTCSLDARANDDFRVVYASSSSTIKADREESRESDESPRAEIVRRGAKKSVVFHFTDKDEEKVARKRKQWEDENMLELASSGEVIRVFTDGSARENGTVRARGGVGVHFPDQQAPSVSLAYRGNHLVVCPVTGEVLREEDGAGVATNQRAELEAIRVAIEMASSTPGYVAKKTQVHIFTDSEYAIKCLTDWIYTWVANGWKNSRRKDVANRDIIQPLFGLVIANRVLFYHTPAHTDKRDERSLGNAAANTLAQDGSSYAKPVRRGK